MLRANHGRSTQLDNGVADYALCILYLIPDEHSVTTFFQQAPQHPKIQAQPNETGYSQQAQDALAEQWTLVSREAQRIEKIRNDEIAKHRNDKDWFPSGNFIGSPLFDADNARGQLWEAALEFAADYERRPQ